MASKQARNERGEGEQGRMPLLAAQPVRQLGAMKLSSMRHEPASSIF